MLPVRESSLPSKRLRRGSGPHRALLHHVEALHRTDASVSFRVLSNSTTASPVNQGDAITPGSFGFYGPPNQVEESLVQLAWATSADDIPERYIAGAICEGERSGQMIQDVLVEFMDCLLSTPKDSRVVTYQMEHAAGLISREMHKSGLQYLRQKFESLIRARGHCLMDPIIHGYMSDSPPSYPSLEEIADVALPLCGRIPKFLRGGEECLLYLRLARGLRAATLPECTRSGHLPIRTMGLAMRDNGWFDYKCERCGVDLP